MSGFDPTSEEDKLFDELSDEHREWIEKALERAPEPMVYAIIAAAAAGGAVALGVPRDVFLCEMARAYDDLPDREGKN